MNILSTFCSLSHLCSWLVSNQILCDKWGALRDDDDEIWKILPKCCSKLMSTLVYVNAYNELKLTTKINLEKFLSSKYFFLFINISNDLLAFFWWRKHKCLMIQKPYVVVNFHQVWEKFAENWWPIVNGWFSRGPPKYEIRASMCLHGAEFYRFDCWHFHEHLYFPSIVMCFFLVLHKCANSRTVH